MKSSVITSILFCCMMALCSQNNNAINAAEVDLRPMPMPLTSDSRPVLTAQDSAIIINAVSKVSPEVKAEFERRRAEWKDACNSSSIKFSSIMKDYTKPAQFTELVNMGEPIIPLVIEKMAQGDFFTQLIYEGIRPAEEYTCKYGSGQQRAAYYVKRWLKNPNEQAK